ncbi:hypothetical protein COCC4DRAFT_99121, partial [Bipolaris maydis ATCC 48331]
MQLYNIQSTILLLAALGAKAAPVRTCELSRILSLDSDVYDIAGDVESKVPTTSDPDPNFAYYNFKREEVKKAADAADPDPNFAYYNFK